jgi:hypothetical protein
MILIMLWLLAVAAGNSALAAKTDSPRYVVVFPALALTTAVGLRYFPPLLVRSSAAHRLALVAVGLSLAVIQTGYYFRVHIPQFIASAPQAHIMDDARFRAADLPDNTHVYIITPIITFEFDSYTTLRYRQRIADGVFITTLHPAEFDDWHLRAMIPQRNYAFFIAPDDDATRALLAAHPEFDLDEPQRSPYDMTFDGLYELYFVPRGWEEADR